MTKYTLHFATLHEEFEEEDLTHEALDDIREDIEGVLQYIPLNVLHDGYTVFVDGDSFIEWGEPFDIGRRMDALHAQVSFAAPTEQEAARVGAVTFAYLIQAAEALPVATCMPSGVFKPLAVTLSEDWEQEVRL